MNKSIYLLVKVFDDGYEIALRNIVAFQHKPTVNELNKYMTMPEAEALCSSRVTPQDSMRGYYFSLETVTVISA